MPVNHQKSFYKKTKKKSPMLCMLNIFFFFSLVVHLDTEILSGIPRRILLNYTVLRLNGINHCNAKKVYKKIEDKKIVLFRKPKKRNNVPILSHRRDLQLMS